MTRTEFGQWLVELGERYPAATDFIEKNGTQDAWFEALEDVPLDQAIDVVRKMLRGDLRAPTPYGGDHSSWPAFVRERAFSLRWEDMRRDTGERDRRDEVLCRFCNDSGYLRVADPRQDRSRILNPPKGWKIVVRSCLCACTCGAGKEHSKEGRPNSNKRPLLEYDSTVMCMFDEGDTQADRHQKLLAFWEDCHKVENHRNYNSEFGDWAETDQQEVVG